MIRLFDTYVHVDGSAASGAVYVRPVVTFTDGTRTYLSDWQPFPLDETGHLDAQIPWPANTDPAPVWLQIMESVTCMRGTVWDIGPQLLTDGANLNLGALRELPAADVSPPRYTVAPAGPTGPAGPPGPRGADGADGARGPVGPQGPAGSGVVIKGNVSNPSQLPTTGNTSGDMWIDSSTGNGYVWDGTQFNNVGPIRGPRGPQGDKGDTGPVGPAGPQGDAGPAGPKGDPGQGIQLLSAVPTPGDLPQSGNTDGDAHIVTSTGDMYVWSGGAWQNVGHLRGPKGDQGDPGPAGPQGAQGPAGPKGDKGDPGDGGVPSDGLDGQVLQWSGGAPDWTDNLATALARTDSLQEFQNNLTDDTVEPWADGPYPADSVVSHNGALWLARTDVVAGEEPGVDGKWRSITLESLWHNANKWSAPKPDDPADDNKVLVASGGDASWQPGPPAHDATKVDRAGAATTLWGGTQAQFDAISVKDPGTIYAVTA